MGTVDSIPEEYRVMTFQDAEELTEEEKSEWAMDIAYDMDEFFRQHDPQYAAEHPEEHAAKEEIYENLMAGRISALDEKLAALRQTQEDYLPSEIEKFKDATGYEEFLDCRPCGDPGGYPRTRTSPMWTRCWPLRSRRAGSMRRSCPSRPRRPPRMTGRPAKRYGPLGVPSM